MDYVLEFLLPGDVLEADAQSALLEQIAATLQSCCKLLIFGPEAQMKSARRRFVYGCGGVFVAVLVLTCLWLCCRLWRWRVGRQLA